MTRLYVDGPTLMRAVEAATRNLERHVDEVDALNVFPVPDGDTGSNMLATMRAALAEAESLPEDGRDLESVAEALSRGALTGARGNSGVILSQIIRGMTHGADGRVRATGVDLAAGLRKGSEVAYQSVLTPVEGTILTVIRDAAEAAESAAGRQPHVEAVLADVIEAAASSVQRTPTLLPVLEDAGVVDSGGQGLYRVLEGMLQVEGRSRRLSRARRRAEVLAERGALVAGAAAPAVTPALATAKAIEGTTSGLAHGYETQYLVSAADGGIDVAALRAAIEAVGDSVVVAGDERLVRVHVHGARPDLAIAAGLALGRISDVEVLDLDDQVAHHVRPSAQLSTNARAEGVSVVAVSAAEGITRVLESLGAHVVVPGHGTRPSVGEIAEAVLACGTTAVVVLPNDRDAMLAADQAAELTTGVDVAVVPTRNAAEGIAATMGFTREASLADNVARMREEAAGVRSFRVITAARDSVVDGIAVQQGQVLALDADRHVISAGTSVEEVTLHALSTMDEIELVTIYCGRSETPGSNLRLCEHIELAGFGAEVEIVDGGQAHDHLLVAVE